MKTWSIAEVKDALYHAGAAYDEAARKKLNELQAAGPRWAVVENAKGDLLSDPSKSERVVDTMLDVCGFARVSIKPATSTFVRLAKKLQLASARYYGGATLRIPHNFNRQEMSANEAGARAAAAYLNTLDLPAFAESRID